MTSTERVPFKIEVPLKPSLAGIDTFCQKPILVFLYAGLQCIPHQVYRRSIRKGFKFNLMMIGEQSLGKAKLLNSLFQSEIYTEQTKSPTARMGDELKIDSFELRLVENGVAIEIEVVDIPGYSDFKAGKDIFNALWATFAQ